MFRHGKISTEVGKGPFIFTLLSFLCCLVTAVLLMILFGRNMLAIFAAMMLMIVAIASFFVLLGLLTDYAYVEDGVLYMSYLFKKSSISLKDIKKMELKDDVYHVFDRRGNEAGTINSLSLGIDDILHELDINGVPFV